MVYLGNALYDRSGLCLYWLKSVMNGRGVVLIERLSQWRARTARCAFGLRLALSVIFLTAVGGCDALNPAFVTLLGDGTTVGTLENAPGHVVVQFINNAEVDERLITFLEGAGLELTDDARRKLRPRVRMRVLVTFANGTTTTIEFVDGSTNLVDPTFDIDNFPDLTQNDLDNAVVRCDVARLEVLPNSSIEVFVPGQLQEYDRQEATQLVAATFIQSGAPLQPQFRVLEVDDVDPDLNTILQNNIPFRRQAAPAQNPFCGSVIAIEMTGVLRLPFLTGTGVVEGQPSYDRADLATEALIPGRFEFNVTFK